jgi:hypothetical protein
VGGGRVREIENKAKLSPAEAGAWQYNKLNTKQRI